MSFVCVRAAGPLGALGRRRVLAEEAARTFCAQPGKGQQRALRCRPLGPQAEREHWHNMAPNWPLAGLIYILTSASSLPPLIGECDNGSLSGPGERSQAANAGGRLAWPQCHSRVGLEVSIFLTFAQPLAAALTSRSPGRRRRRR